MPTITNDMNDLVFPEYSVYSGEQAMSKTQPFRIDEGRFAGTIFTYNDIFVSEEGLDDSKITYSADIQHLQVDGKDAEVLEAVDHDDLYESIGNILIYILSEYYKNDKQ